jgi:hypothetical protein
MVEAARDDGQRDAGVEHLGGHEVSEVVEPELPASGGAAVADEGFGDAVGLPCRHSPIVAEHEPSRVILTQYGERLVGERRDLEAVAPFRLGRRHGRTGGSLHPASNERDALVVVVDLFPRQPEQLCSAGAGRGGEQHERVEPRIARLDVIEEVLQLCWCRRMQLGWWDDDAVCSFVGVVPDPSPPHRLGERGAEHDVDPVECPWFEGATSHAAALAQGGVGGVDDRWCDVADAEVAEVRVQAAVEDRTCLAGRGRRP